MSVSVVQFDCHLTQAAHTNDEELKVTGAIWGPCTLADQSPYMKYDIGVCFMEGKQGLVADVKSQASVRGTSRAF